MSTVSGEEDLYVATGSLVSCFLAGLEDLADGAGTFLFDLIAISV